MPRKKTKLPKEFSPYNKPFAPYKPKETRVVYQSIKNIPVYDGSHVDVKEFPADATHVSVDLDGGYDGDVNITLSFYAHREETNPTYKKDLARYQEECARYKVEIKEWKRLKVIYDKEQAEKKEEFERRWLKQLQEKYKE